MSVCGRYGCASQVESNDQTTNVGSVYYVFCTAGRSSKSKTGCIEQPVERAKAVHERYVVPGSIVNGVK